MVMRSEIRNREREEEFDVRWNDPQPGMGRITSVLRVKNEARSLPWVLPGLFRVVDRLVLVDNGSDDGTPEVAKQVAEEQGAADRIEVFEYPFSVARCGPEHLSVPPDSLHSLTYFYNWAFSHVKTAYNMKWDGDMVLTEDGERYIHDLKWQLEGTDQIVQIPRYAVYVESDTVAYVDAGMAAVEAWLWPNKPAYHFGKAFEWEILVRPQGTPVMRLPEWTVFELKWLDADEFTNWSSIDPKATIRTGRKNRDWTIFHAVKEGEVPEDVYKVESTDGRHVIDVLRDPSSARYVTDNRSTETAPLIP